MGPDDIDLRDGRPVSQAALVADATNPADVLSMIEAVLGGGVLFAIDHAVEKLVPVRPDGSRTVDLDGALRQSILRAEPYDDGTSRWTPIPERDQAIYVIRQASEAQTAATPASTDRSLGSVMEGHRHRFERLEQQRRRKEMSIAAELQWDMLPVRGEFFDGCRVAGVLEPAYEVAGDAFDYAFFDGSVWAYSFDGMGHGMQATLTSAVVVAAVRNARRRGFGLTAQMDHASHAVHEQWGGDRFVTGVGCRYTNGRTEFVNAGHEPARVVVDGHAARLDLTAELPLGVIENHRYTEQSGPTLADGDGVVLLSDGSGSALETHGAGADAADRLDELVQGSWSDRPVATSHGVLDEVLRQIGDDEVEDDLTAVVLYVDETVGSA